MRKVLCILLAALLLGGCGAAKERDHGAAAAPAETPAVKADNEPGGENGYYGTLYVGEGKESETNTAAFAPVFVSDSLPSPTYSVP